MTSERAAHVCPRPDPPARGEGERGRNDAPSDVPSNVSAPRRAALVANLSSSRAQDSLLQAHSLLEQRGWQISAVRAPRDPSAIADTVRRLLDEGHRQILLGGGDGTINAALPALVEADAVLGVLPFGTANSFARALGVPLQLDAAIDAITAGHVERIDLGRLDHRYFATTASLGLAVAVAAALPSRLKRRLGVLSYPIIGATVLLRHRPFRCKLRWAQGEFEGKVLDVLVANAPYQGGAPVAPDADPQNRKLFVRVVTGERRWNILRLWWYAFRGRAGELPFVIEFETPRLMIETQPAQHINADGELSAWTPIEVSTAPQALAVMLPASSERAGSAAIRQRRSERDGAAASSPRIGVA